MAKLLFCPFIIENGYDKRGTREIRCEHGKLIFHNKGNMKEFIGKYCGSEQGWKTCSLSCSLMKYYEEHE